METYEETVARELAEKRAVPMVERQADARTWAGFRRARRSTDSGSMIVLVDGWAQGIESPDSDGFRWALICDDHDICVTFETLTAARSQMAAPLGWCEHCAEEHEVKL